MKVILLKDVPRVGRRYEVVDVSDGYANNFLFPQKLAEPATDAKVKELDKRKEALKAQEDARVADLAEKLETLEEREVVITVKADEQGHLYKKLQVADIAHALLEEHDIELPTTTILLDGPITEVGDHEIPVEAVGKEVTLKVSVVKE